METRNDDSLKNLVTVRMMHPTDTGPEYLDNDNQPAQIVICPDCGQMEWWTELENTDHGYCRAQQPGNCPVCDG